MPGAVLETEERGESFLQKLSAAGNDKNDVYLHTKEMMVLRFWTVQGT